MLHTDHDPSRVGRNGINQLRVRLLQGRNLKIINSITNVSSHGSSGGSGKEKIVVPAGVDKPLICSFRLVYRQTSLKPSDSVKSHPKRVSEDNTVSWEQNDIVISPVLR